MNKTIKFNREDSSKPYINIKTELIEKCKIDFKKKKIKLITNAVFRKAIENVRKYRIIKPAKKEIFSVRTKLSHRNFFQAFH